MSEIYDQEIARKVAVELLTIKTVKLQPQEPFTWASGILSPIYCDNRSITSYPYLRKFVAVSFSKLIREKAPGTERVAGIATGAIAHGSNVANELDLPFLYVRDKPKEHGRKNQVEGILNGKDPTFVIEDLISTGGSSHRAIEALRAEGAYITGLASIVTYGLPEAEKTFSEADYPIFSLTNYDTIIQAAVEMDYISADEIAVLQEWKKDPRAWRGPQ